MTASDHHSSTPSWAGAEIAVLAVGLLLMSGGVLPLFLGPPNAAWNPEGYPAVQVVLLLFYGVVTLLLAMRWRDAWNLASRDPLLWVLMAWVVLSVSWSDAPSLSARRALALVLTTGVGLYIAVRFEIEDQLRLLAWTLALAALLSVLAVVLFPDYGIDRQFWRGPAWRGVYTHKNGLGRTMALLTAAGLALALGAHPRAYRWMIVAALSAALPFLARSFTSLIAVVSMYGLLALLLAWHRLFGAGVEGWQLQRLIVAITMAAAVWMGVWYLQQPAPAATPAGAPTTARSELTPPGQMAITDRQSTATARLELWKVAGDKIVERPWLGYGYGAFWRGDQGPSAYVWSTLGWKPPGAHNGFIDVILGLGAVGLLLMCAHLIKTGAHAVRAFLGAPLCPASVWPLLFVVFFCLYNLPETSMLVQNSLLWPVYVAVALSCAERPSGSDGTSA